jgi:3-hydroxyacyl-[acyl-carrier-protein] dehydratase
MEDMKNLLPHREPFLFVERLEKVSDEEIIGYRTFTDNDFFFKGHFPGFPVVPGVILIESMAQCGGAGIKSMDKLGKDALFFLATVVKAKFKRPVKPGDEIKMVITNLRISPNMLRQSGKAYVGEELACSAEWMCIVGSAEDA